MRNRLQRALRALLSGAISAGTICGVIAEVSSHFQCWRRKTGCECSGCRNWQRVERGESTVEAIGQPALRCRNRFLAWEADSVYERRVNPVMACFWALVLLLSVFNVAAVPGVTFAIVVTVGKNDMLTQYFKGSAYTAAWSLGLVDGASAPTYAAGDTMSSHSGWTENTGYSNATRVTLTFGTAASGSIDNTASAAAFNINATGTIAGSFSTTSSTKGGTSGTLYGESNFTQGNRSVVSGDTLNGTKTNTV